MTHTLQITRSGSTIDLTSGSYTLLEYVPQSPNITTIDSNSVRRDGGRRTAVSRRNVSETARVLLVCDDPDLIQAEKQKIQNWFTLSEKNQTMVAGSPTYINFDKVMVVIDANRW